MDLTDSQIETLKAKAEEGGQLNDLQKIIQNDFGKHITYMETRFLISDMQIEIKTEVEEKPEEEEVTPEEPDADLADESKVSVSVDQVTRPGVMASGKVAWSDGKTSQWYVDEMGRLGLDSEEEGYKPSPEDIEDFQIQLKKALGA